MSDAQISNFAYSLVHNIANIRDNLKQWARHNDHDPRRIDDFFKNSTNLKLVQDLSDNDKHGYPPRNGGYLGTSPKLVDIRRTFRGKTMSKPGSFIAITLTSSGLKQSGDGTSCVIITGVIVDKAGGVLGDLYDVCLSAVAAWEQELKALGVIV